MKILVVGGGGESTLSSKSLKKSPRVTEIYAAPGNGGIAADAICTGIGAKDLAGITTLPATTPLILRWWPRTIPWSWGSGSAGRGGNCLLWPKKRLPFWRSKVFSKDLMKKYHSHRRIPGFLTTWTRRWTIKDRPPSPLWLRPMAWPGKGVTVATTRQGGGGGSARLHGGQNLERAAATLSSRSS